MATLVSPGVSVSITNESFFIPASAPTVPLLFIATADEKINQTTGLPYEGTTEHGVIRTITSPAQLYSLYGSPTFWQDYQGNPQHGDARNEYGLAAMFSFLGVGNIAFAVRANVNLDDDRNSILAMWQRKTINAISGASAILEQLTAQRIAQYNSTNNFAPTGTGIGTLNTLVGGSAYANGTYTSVPLTGGTGTGATATFVVAGGTVTSVTLQEEGTRFTVGDALGASLTGTGVTGLGVITAGSLYTDGTYLNVPLTGGTGTGATADIVVAGGVVTSVTLTAAGSGYVVGQVLSALAASIGGTGSSFSVPVLTVAGSGFSISVASLAFKVTVNATELKSDINTAMQIAYDMYSFSKIVVRNSNGVIVSNWFEDDYSASPQAVYANGYNAPSTGNFIGVAGMTNAWVTTFAGSVVPTEWTPAEAAQLLIDAATDFQYTVPFLNVTSLGSNDAARRLAIVTALQAAVSGNQDVRAENFEYNLILCPGYHELVDELNTLSVDIMEEALVIGETPMDMDPDNVVVWGDSTTSTRVHSENVAYYYPHGLTAHPFTGTNIMVAGSGIALRTYAYSDNQADLWWAPAGIRRGLVSGISQCGYVSGVLGTATTFNVTPLTQGQRDNMYKYSTNINPITNLPGTGLVVFGQKTSAPAASAMDRVNVSRMIKYIKRQLRKNVVSFLFEPNDQLTRNNLKAVVDGFLSGIMHKRGLYDFATICDSSNNTPDRIDQNELYIDIALKPTKAVEFIYIPIRILATGAAMGN